jgi:hypothetical protein
LHAGVIVTVKQIVRAVENDIRECGSDYAGARGWKAELYLAGCGEEDP